MILCIYQTYLSSTHLLNNLSNPQNWGGASIKSNFIGVILFSIGSLPLQEEIRVSMTDPGKNSLQELR